MSSVGGYIAAERERVGVSLRDLAQRLGVTATELGEIERGVRGISEVERWRIHFEIDPTSECGQRHRKVTR